jgi:site-specific DNA recombinase
MGSTGRRGAIYVRVSTKAQAGAADNGNGDGGTSLETQEEACQASCAAQGITVDAAHVYREVPRGGELWERPALTALRAAMRAGDVDIIVAYAVDRLSRNQHHLGLLVSEAERHGVALAFVTEQWDETPQGKFMRSALGFMAEMEREKIKERTMRGKRARVAGGRPLAGHSALYGYRWNATRTGFEIDEEQAPIVRWIFAEIAGGASLRGLANALTRRGIPLPDGDRPGHTLWAHRTVQRMVQHPAYWGQGAALRTRVEHVTHRDKETGTVRKVRHAVLRPADEQVLLPGVYPAIVTAELAAEVQARLTFNRTNLLRPSVYNDTVLNGFAKCGYCGGTMRVKRFSPAPSRTRPHAPSYLCGRKDDRRTFPCTSHAITTPQLDAAVWQIISTALRDPEIIARELAKMQTSDPTVADLKSCEARLASIAEQQANLAHNAARLTGSAADPLLAILERLDAERKDVEAERVKLLDQHTAWETRRTHLLSVQQWRAKVASRLDREPTREQKRDVFRAVELEVRVYRSNDPDHDKYEIDANIPLDGAIGTNMVTTAPVSTMRAASRALSGG